jgi:hypothetical protein
MFLDNNFAWLVILVVLSVLYYPVMSRLFKIWKRSQKRKKRTPPPLLGVVYPPSDKDK